MRCSVWNRVLLALVLISAAGLIARAVSAPQTTSTENSGVSYFPHQEVSARFAKGGCLYRPAEGNFNVMTARRDHGGDSELHRNYTDIFYIVKGSAAFVTGGKMVNPRQIGPGEMRGSGVAGGRTWHLSTGDVIVIPAGTPHWFKQVSSAVLYFVVKVRQE
ncbi:MAG TPA: cupin domain-containing protein [Terriglobia bacterium]|nr:cupin domain-containing protein [Terriglobia bacterium]